MQHSEPKVALITGANKGIGLEIARQLGDCGIAVLIGARSRALGERAAERLRSGGIAANVIEIDVTDRHSAATAAETIASEFGRLDILVNNAGINDSADGPPERADLDAVERVLSTNFLGALTVTQAFLPLLRKATAGRIVNVSSGLGSLTQNGDPQYPSAAAKLIGYNASKAALNMLTVQLAFTLRDTSIKVNSADPGYTATDLNAHSGHQTIPEGAAEAVRLALLADDAPSGAFTNTQGTVPW